MSDLEKKITDTNAECAKELNSSTLFPVVEKLRAQGTCESLLRSVLASSNREQTLATLAAQLGQAPEQQGTKPLLYPVCCLPVWRCKTWTDWKACRWKLL